MTRRKREGNEDLGCMGSRVKEEVEKNARQEALVLPKSGLQNLLQSVDRNGNLSCCRARREIELGMPAGHFLKRKSNFHLKLVGLNAQLPRACAVVSAPSVMQELGVCRAMDRCVHQCFLMALLEWLLTQKTGKCSCVVCRH